VQSQLVESSGGVFEIEYGGKLLFSKKKVGRFPEHTEVVDLIKRTEQTG